MAWRHSAVLLAFLLWWAPGAALGQPSAGELTAAREAFLQGVAAARDGRWQAAHEGFSRSYALYPTPQTLLNLAGAQAQTGRLVEATEGYRRYLRQVGDGTDPNMWAARQVLQELEPRIPRARLRVLGLLDGDDLELDSEVISHAVVGTSLPVNPGQHRLGVRRLAEEVAFVSFSAGEGQEIAVRLDVPAPPPERVVFPAGDPGALYRDESSVVDKWWFWTIVGAVAITGIVVVGVVASASPDAAFQGNAGLVRVR